MLADGLPRLTRTDKRANVVQTFLTSEEKKVMAEACESLGVPMSHLLRVLTLQWLKSQKKQ